MLYLEDLHVGDRFISRAYEMTVDEIKQFAHQFDPQPFHTNEIEAANHPIFKGLAASGWHTSAVTMRLWTECFPVAYGLIGSEAQVRWPRPTRAGDQIHVEVEITEIKPSKSKPVRAIVSYTTETLNQNGEAVLLGNTKILVFSKNYRPDL